MASRRKSVLITGCSKGGLGDALARELHQRGLRVIATARDTSKMDELIALGVETHTLDVLSSQSIQECVSTISSLTDGTLDYLINNAGAGYMLPITDVSLPLCRQLFDLNVWSVVALTQTFLPLLLKAKGVLAIQTSVGSVVPTPGLGIYNASKAALASLTDNLRVELSPFDVRVVELKTGSVKSNFFASESTSAVKLPDTSLYTPIKSMLEPMLNGDTERDRKRQMDKGVWAKFVVTELLKQNPPAQIWKGGGASPVWWIRTLLPHTFMDSILASMAGLDKLRSTLRSKEH
jgi:1-acylglycerone phosphate reductase